MNYNVLTVGNVCAALVLGICWGMALYRAYLPPDYMPFTRRWDAVVGWSVAFIYFTVYYLGKAGCE